MNITLKPELEKFVAERVDRGDFTDASDVVNEALTLLKEHEDLSREEDDDVRAQLLPAIEQLDPGEYSTLDAKAIIAQERARLTARQEQC